MSYIARRLDSTAGVLRRRALWLCAFSCLLLLGLFPRIAAAQEETHLFNAALSLTGDCSTSTIDPVPDPGCPGGAHPAKPFTKDGGVAVDRYGDRYVASAGPLLNGSQGRIDIFSPAGVFITEIAVALPEDDVSLAVDSQGYLYVGRQFEDETQRLLRYAPTKYNPGAGEIEYGAAPAAIPNPTEPGGEWSFGNPFLPVAVNPANDHLLVLYGRIVEFSSATEGSSYIQTVPLQGIVEGGRFANSLAVDAVHKRIYVTDLRENPTMVPPPVIRAYNLEAPHELLLTIDGSTTPTGRFVSETRALPLAADEATGHVFVGDLEAPTRRVYEFDSGGQLVSTIEGPLRAASDYLLEMAYDNGPTSPTKGYLFVPSGSGPAHSLGFEPISHEAPPVVEGISVSDVTVADAVLHGDVNPEGVETTYRFEYTTEQAFLANGFQGAKVAGDGTLKPAGDGVPVSASVSDLSAGTAYRFRIVAQSPLGEDEAASAFVTFPALEVFTGCPNQALRTGASAVLPDCRAYELVTPTDTNGHSPYGSRGPVNSFKTRQVSPAGDKLPFKLEGGALSGLEGTGGFNGDPYLATRTATGWATSYVGPSAAESPGTFPGTSSPDQGYSFWEAEEEGNPSNLFGGLRTSYLRYPDGHSAPLGQGSLGVDPSARGRLISSEGSHVIFETGGSGPNEAPIQLEPTAAPDGTPAIYDRTADGVLHVVSLKPNGSPFEGGENAEYAGASFDGVGVAFEVEKTLYLRYDDAETFRVGEGVEFAGVAEGGGRVFYVEGGDLKAFDVAREASIAFSQSRDVTPVIVAGNGHTAYFVSPTDLSAGPNPNGEEAQPGKQNLYRSEEGQIQFVATVTERDVKGESGRDGLGLWLNANKDETFGTVPARSTPDGQVLLFQSRARLTGYDSEGHAEIYRYDAAADKLTCLSCSPTAAASTDASLQYEGGSSSRNSFYDLLAWPEDLRADGRRAFFESGDALVADDTDGLTDVYEWEDQGVGSCTRPAGCIYLITSGQSGREEHLWAVSQSGDDVFFVSSDLLTEEDTDETPSVYDARVDGGFAPSPRPAAECLGEACQPPAAALADLTPSSFTFQGFGNVRPALHRVVHKQKRHKKHKKHKRHKRHGHRGHAGHGKGRAGR